MWEVGIIDIFIGRNKLDTNEQEFWLMEQVAVKKSEIEI